MQRFQALSLMICIAVGCSSPVEDVTPDASLDSQAKVNVVEIDGALAKVRTDDGRELFVPVARLQERSGLDRSDDYTHVLAAQTDAYDEAPAALPQPPPRPTKEIVLERLNLNQLYLTEKTHKEVIAPARLMMPWDEESGERCFPAMTCENPDCPGEPRGEYPNLFIVPFSPSSGGGTEIVCPACAEVHDPATRTEEERMQYRKWIKPYRLPEQAARMKQLDAEIRSGAIGRRARRDAPPVE